MKKTIQILMLAVILCSCKNKEDKVAAQVTPKTHAEATKIDEAQETDFVINPVEHASMVLKWDESVIYVDPVGGADMYSSYPQSSLILITDIHGDHLDIPTLEALVAENTSLIVPQAVYDKLPQELQKTAQVMNNGAKTSVLNINIEAVPMYNLRAEALKFHEKGRGNGYVLEKNGMRVYISGDTEDIPEMRDLKNIDIAFVCMNLPYTMPVEKAVEAVLDFKPKKVYPYHYRGQNRMSDVAEFKSLVETQNPDIEVVQLDWYSKN